MRCLADTHRLKEGGQLAFLCRSSSGMLIVVGDRKGCKTVEDKRLLDISLSVIMAGSYNCSSKARFLWSPVQNYTLLTLFVLICFPKELFSPRNKDHLALCLPVKRPLATRGLEGLQTKSPFICIELHFQGKTGPLGCLPGWRLPVPRRFVT